MKTVTLIFAIITILLPFLSQKTGLSHKYGFRMKMLCALMYLATGVFSTFTVSSVTAYSVMILVALFFGVLGDFFLEFKGKRYFPLGAAFFAVGHIVYSLTFLFVGAYRGLSDVLSVVAITIILTIIIVVLAKTRLTLKGKKNLLLIYAPVLIFAFACSLVSGVISVNDGNYFYGICVISGGSLFLASDIMIGVGKGGIQRPDFLHNAVSYTYFTAQALLSLSILYQ